MPKLISRRTFRRIELMFETGGRSYTEIASTVGVHLSVVRKIAEGKHYYQCDSAEQGRRREGLAGNQPVYLPTPEQIESECARLRAERKPNEVDDPEADDPDGWPPPAITLGTLD